MKYYDLIIIWTWGGGKLRLAAELWKKVAIIEKDTPWGTCLNRWCIPSKMFIYPSDLLTHFKEDAYKLHIIGKVKNKIDFKKLVKEVNWVINTQSENIRDIYDNNENIDYYHGSAKFVENKVIKVNGELLTAHNIYIATWSRPQIPNIKWLSDTPYFTSKEALENHKLPKKMIIIWAWYIATELWHFYGAAGTEIHFLVRSELLKNEDKDIRKEFTRDFMKRYNVHFWISPIEVNYKKKTFYVTVSDIRWNEKVLESDALLVATWVIPNSDELWIENTEIELNDFWYIKVDDYLETTVKWVYALGDVIGKYLFRHSVNFEWEYLFRQHYWGDNKEKIRYPAMPHAVFSYPQIAWVWETEDSLIAEKKVNGKDYFVWLHKYKDSAMWMASKPNVWLVKIIANKHGKLLWAHIVWEKASDIIGMLIVYVSQWAYVQNILKEIIFIHPALSEVIRNALRSVNKQLKKEAG